MENLLVAPETTAEQPTPPDTSHLITEDDVPVDNLFSEKQQRLLTEPLYSSWAGPGEERRFLVAANVGVFYSVHRPAVVPDVFLSLDVEMPENWWETAGRSYLLWEHGKPPDVVIEIASNDKGDELGRRLRIYEQMRVFYYVVFDPDRRIQQAPLVIYQLGASGYSQTTNQWLASVQLGLTLWDGVYEGRETTWLRWRDSKGDVIPTGQERAEREHNRAERLAAQLRALGIDPETDLDINPSNDPEAA